nr:type I polyketide synthase [Micromonospora qiuiae]
MANPDVDPTDVGWSLATTRAHLPFRAAVLGADRDSLIAGLTSLADGMPDASVVQGSVVPGKTVFVFPGQGSQWAGMARELLQTSDTFAAHLHACADALAPYLDWSILDVLNGAPDAPSLERIEVVQPALFAVLTSLAQLWRHHGVHPNAVVGHSQGEVAAAYVAGALTLDDAARIAALRCRSLATIVGQGTLAFIPLPAEEVEGRLSNWGGQLNVAAVNGPASTIVTGDQPAIDELLADCAAAGIRAKAVPAAVASHGPHIEPLRDRVLHDLAGITPRPSEVPFYSTVTGELLDTTELTAEYWYTNLRQPVLYQTTIQTLSTRGHNLFIEVSPHPVLTTATQETLDEGCAVFGTLRRDQGGEAQFLASLAHAHSSGATVDWSAVYGTDACVTALPTYGFERQRYWAVAEQTADVVSAGLTAAEHPFLGAMAQLPGGGHLFTGRVSAQAHPWLGEHSVGGLVLVPGTAFAELALHAGEQVGSARLDELILQAPLILRGDADLQVQVGEADDAGRRPVIIRSRGVGQDGWVSHVHAVVAPDNGVAEQALAAAWPPPGATALSVDELYGRLVQMDVTYGPSYRGLRAAWRSGDRVYAEVSLPEGVDTAGFAIHPALLDAALQPIGLLADDSAGDQLHMPFAWNGLRLHATGASALRVEMAAVPGQVDTVAVRIADAAGAPLADIESVALRAVTADQLRASGAPPLLHVGWTPVTADSPGPDRAVRVVPLADLAGDGGADPVAATHTGVAGLLALLHDHLASDTDDHLVILTSGAVSAAGEPAADLPGAAAWGLLAAFQAEHPGRVTAVAHDPAAALSEQELAAALATGEPQVAVHDGRMFVPRLLREHVEPGTVALDPDSTILITEGTSGIGAASARHFATRHGARHLILTSSPGTDTTEAERLSEELSALDVTVTVASCDTADAGQLAELIDGIPAERPLSAVVHCATAPQDAGNGTLSAQELAAVLRRYVDAAWHLHELTRDHDLTAFVLHSPAAGAIGNSGPASHSAARAFLDALARQRRQEGRPALSVAYETEAAAGSGSVSDRPGWLATISVGAALDLMDQALAAGQPSLVAVRLDQADLRHEESVPAVLRGFVRPAVRRGVAAAAAAASPLAGQLARLTEPEQLRFLHDVINGHVTAVLGHPSGSKIDIRRPFKELGFDSLTAVELRNRLGTSIGVRLPATLVFDHPTPVALARYLRAALLERGGDRATPVAAPTASETDPIVVVGMGCRYPGGVRSPEDLWQLVAGGVNAIGEFPTDRGWDIDSIYDPTPGVRGKTYVRSGGFIYDVAGFDAAFFGISPREALATDPQQRILLETAWETLEDAGIPPESLRGTRTGVFTGLVTQGYAMGAGGSTEAVDGYLMTGGAASVASGRIAYTLGLEGSAVTVDTACSSSLVALHLAAQALRRGECDLALAGGATVLAAPTFFSEFSYQQGLAPDGRCKAFAAAADGTGLSDGAGMLLLERLSDARANGHRILAVIRGSAINQDGASNGLTAPNGPSQERLIREALATAGLASADVDVVEGHGTGTTLGDPIEAHAVLATYGRHRPENHPLWLGSIKSNIGHTSAAAGVAGVIKMIQAMRHGVLPKTLHVDEPSPHIDWDSGAVRLITEAAPWPDVDRPRRAAISSFGISGTNAHVILEEGPREPEVPHGANEPDQPVAWLLSAKTPSALRMQARRMGEFVANRSELPAAAVAHALATTRTHFAHRAVVVAADRQDRLAALSSLADGLPGAGVVQGVAQDGGKTVFVFPGQGSQWAGMARELMHASDVFAAELRTCADALAPYLDWSVLDVLDGAPDAPSLELIEVVQPALFAVLVSLAELWRHHGVHPDAVVGHSQGEVAAAYVAGALSLDDAARIAALRCRALATMVGGGTLAFVPLPAADVEDRLARWGGRLTIAATNGPTSTIVTGDLAAIDELLADSAAAGIRAKAVPAAVASHGPHIESIREQVLRDLAGITPRAARVPFYSTVTADVLDTTQLTPEYWYTNLRQPVQYKATIEALHSRGHNLFIEVSPHPVLTTATQDTLNEDSAPERAIAIGTLRRDDGGRARLLASLGEAFAEGAPVDWTTVLPAPDGPRVTLPTYPFEHQQFWLVPGNGTDVTGAGLSKTDHPLLSAMVELPDGGWLFTGRLSLATHRWLADHALAGAVLLPGAGHVELALFTGRHAGADRLAELAIDTPLILPEQGSVDLQVAIGPSADSGQRTVTIRSRRWQPGHDSEWARHAYGLLERSEAAGEVLPWPPPPDAALPVEGFYDQLSRFGLDYGPSFQGLCAAWRADSGAWGEVRLPEGTDADGFGIHPALLDAALHTLAVHHGLLTTGGEGEPVRLPFVFHGVSLHSTGATAARTRLTVPEGQPDTLTLRMSDSAGAPLLSIDKLTLRQVDAQQLRAGSASSRPLYRVEWTVVPAPAAPAPDEAVPHVIDLTGLADDSDGDPATVTHATTEALLRELQHRLGEDDHTPVVVLTHHAMAVSGDQPVSLPAAAAWGMVRAVQAEHPGRITAIDNEAAAAPDLAVIRAARSTGEPQIAIRDQQLHAPRLTRLPVSAPGGEPVVDPEGTVLITGGTGTLAAATAEHLITRHGARHLVLASRTGPNTAATGRLHDRLSVLGATVTTASCDTADPEQLAALVAAIPAARPITAVIHCAGTIEDATVGTMTVDQLHGVLAPKVDTAWHLHRLTQHHPVLTFALFSSAAGTIGNPGQANYAAANTFLDALAHHRRRAGQPATSLAWGMWEQDSALTATLSAQDRARLTRYGLVPMPTQQALQLLDRAITSEQPDVLTAHLNLATLRQLATDGQLPAVMRRLLPSTPGTATATTAAPLGQRLADLSPPEQQELILNTLRTHTAAVLGHGNASQLDLTQPFKELGFDSLTAVELRNRLSAATGQRLPATVVFDHPTPTALATYLRRRLAPEQTATATALEHLVRLESVLSGIQPGSEDEGQVGNRLRALLAKWTGARESAEQAVTEKLEAASTAEIFDFIDRELGRTSK